MGREEYFRGEYACQGETLPVEDQAARALSLHVGISFLSILFVFQVTAWL